MVREGFRCPLPPHPGGTAEHAPVAVLLDPVAAPLAPLPVARVLAGMRGLRGTLEDPKTVPQALPEVALVHLVSAIPAEGTSGGPASQSSAQGRTWSGSPPASGPGHLLTDAIATHAAFPPVALVTVELVLRGLGHQADAKAVSVGGQGELAQGRPDPKPPSYPPGHQEWPCLQGFLRRRGVSQVLSHLLPGAPLRTPPPAPCTLGAPFGPGPPPHGARCRASASLLYKDRSWAVGVWESRMGPGCGQGHEPFSCPHTLPQRPQPYPCSRPWQKLPTWFCPFGHFRVPLEHRRGRGSNPANPSSITHGCPAGPAAGSQRPRFPSTWTPPPSSRAHGPRALKPSLRLHSCSSVW